jgi:heme o synthase
MSGVVSKRPVAEPALSRAIDIAPGWLRLAGEFVEIAKPRIALMVLVAVTVGFGLGCQGQWRIEPWIHAMVGVALAATSASAFNQLLERRTDALMRRTAGRALPTGRLAPRDVFWFGVAAAVIAIGELALFTNLTTTLLTIACLALYALAYTLLKPRSALCTAVGAVPGALPILLGWTAAGGGLSIEGWTLFAIMFLWQFPHFLAIAWRYRDQYSAAGLRMLPGGGSHRIVGLLAMTYALALIPVSLLPREQGLAGNLYAVTALGLGLWYAIAALGFARRGTDGSARRLLWASLVHLPVLLGVLLFDHWRLLQ